MTDSNVEPIELASLRQLVESIEKLVTKAIEVARHRTDAGKLIDEAQPQCERLAYAATELAAAREPFSVRPGCGRAWRA